MPATTIVVPCYNEAERLRPASFLDAAASQRGLNFLFVDDGSRDATADVLRQLCAQRPDQLEWMSLPENAGKAEAVRRGFLRALLGNADYVGYWDADLATPLDAIPHFVSVLEEGECDLVMGSRIRLLGRHIERRPGRHYVGRVFATLVGIVLDQPVYDTQCGAKLFRKTPVLERVMAEPFRTRWIFDIEVLARYLSLQSDSARAAARIVEYPLEEWRDVAGTKLRSIDFVHAAWDLGRIAAQYAIQLRRRRVRGSDTGGE